MSSITEGLRFRLNNPQRVYLGAVYERLRQHMALFCVDALPGNAVESLLEIHKRQINQRFKLFQNELKGIDVVSVE